MDMYDNDIIYRGSEPILNKSPYFDNVGSKGLKIKNLRLHFPYKEVSGGFRFILIKNCVHG